MLEKSEYYIHSTNGKNRIHVIQWKPVEVVRAILQIAHGMCEYADRYDEFATYLARQGILVVANDHLGHGESVRSREELGYFPVKKKSRTVVMDMVRVSRDVRARYPDLPFFLLGHSMGSFLARRYMMTYGKMLSGVILSGTGAQPQAALRAGQFLANAIGVIRGPRHRSQTLQKIAFSSYNRRFEPVRTDYDWLSVNTENVDRYIADPLCGFVFTVNGFQTLFDVLEYIQDEKNLALIPSELPVLMIYGSEDPVGHYGKDISSIRRQMKKAGVRQIRVQSYPGDRHEILQEDDRGQVFADILAFMEKVMERPA